MFLKEELKTFKNNRPKSKKLWEKAIDVLPGGISHNIRTFGLPSIGGFPVIISSASGPFIKDIDENKYLDDYAYLASIPSSVFLDEHVLYSNPLIYYQDNYPKDEDKYRTLNTRPGIDCFMEDWMGYCDGIQDQMTLINIPENKVDPSWKAKEYEYINGNDPYNIAKRVLLDYTCWRINSWKRFSISAPLFSPSPGRFGPI